MAELLCANSGRERTSAIVYALGWTQHTTGVQMIRTAGILQLLLGNMGRPGGGIMAMRGHSTIQGSTDVATLYDSLPGYLPQPAADTQHETLDSYVAARGPAHRLLGQLPQVHRQPAQGVVRRRGHAGERLRLRLAAADRRRLLATRLLRPHGAGGGEGLLPVRPEPRRRRDRTPDCTAPACGTSTGWSSSTGSRPRARSSGRATRPGRRPPTSRPRSSSSPRRPRRRRRAASPTRSG